MHLLSLSHPSGSLAIGSALGLSLFERGMVSIVCGGTPIDLAPCERAEAGSISFADQPYFLTNRSRVSAQGLSGASLV
jgi:hypothetical protein